jgi:hypothetical protein
MSCRDRAAFPDRVQASVAVVPPDSGVAHSFGSDPCYRYRAVALVTTADRKRHERIMIEEAVTKPRGGYINRAVSPEMSIPRLLGDELIDASRAAVTAYYTHDDTRLDHAIKWLATLVGGAP